MAPLWSVTIERPPISVWLVADTTSWTMFNAVHTTAKSLRSRAFASFAMI